MSRWPLINMNERYFIVTDYARLRIFRQRQQPGLQEPDIEEIDVLDFPSGRSSYTDREAFRAGRFQGLGAQTSSLGTRGGISAVRTGMSIDERLPIEREEDRRRGTEVASQLEAFLTARPEANWELICAEAMQYAILRQLSDGVRRRLQRTLPKDLTQEPHEQLRAQLVGAGQ